MADKVTISLTILLTGFVVVFAVLLLLIGVIKLYGTIIYKIQTSQKARKDQMPSDEVAAPAASEPAVIVQAADANEDELIAVISAAVYSMYSGDKVRIKSIRKSPLRTDAWRSAGLGDSIRPF